jgi:ribosomal protein S14
LRRKTGYRERESVFAAEREADREKERVSLRVREKQIVKERDRCFREIAHERERERSYREREREVNCYNDKKNYIKKIIMMCKIVMREKMMWQIFMKSN